ncbi:Hypothetical Protein FCC1311_054861 [Hondaea fermentalgiana]|uniref:Uncharacterized protein n=1 Tax=Hondaea fermentalgiana TaxID=2315210 RepID=A0A2R5G4H8_9STRA|nr:Hypothetical Protein FCC1311_054861 [Hondaea fermentalgiana]|eukprot:GBG25465.1 Hypothetical Protein FCC1311_054861 [Hondaea fermentalgiana]
MVLKSETSLTRGGIDVCLGCAAKVHEDRRTILGNEDIVRLDVPVRKSRLLVVKGGETVANLREVGKSINFGHLASRLREDEKMVDEASSFKDGEDEEGLTTASAQRSDFAREERDAVWVVVADELVHSNFPLRLAHLFVALQNDAFNREQVVTVRVANGENLAEAAVSDGSDDLVSFTAHGDALRAQAAEEASEELPHQVPGPREPQNCQRPRPRPIPDIPVGSVRLESVHVAAASKSDSATCLEAERAIMKSKYRLSSSFRVLSGPLPLPLAPLRLASQAAAGLCTDDSEAGANIDHDHQQQQATAAAAAALSASRSKPWAVKWLSGGHAAALRAETVAASTRTKEKAAMTASTTTQRVLAATPRQRQQQPQPQQQQQQKVHHQAKVVAVAAAGTPKGVKKSASDWDFYTALEEFQDDLGLAAAGAVDEDEDGNPLCTAVSWASTATSVTAMSCTADVMTTTSASTSVDTPIAEESEDDESPSNARSCASSSTASSSSSTCGPRSASSSLSLVSDGEISPVGPGVKSQGSDPWLQLDDDAASYVIGDNEEALV